MAHLLEIETFPIVVNARGEWSHGGKPLHPRVEKLFRESVRVNADGSYRIELGRNQSDIEVADVAFFVTSLELALDDGHLARLHSFPFLSIRVLYIKAMFFYIKTLTLIPIWGFYGMVKNMVKNMVTKYG